MRVERTNGAAARLHWDRPEGERHMKHAFLSWAIVSLLAVPALHAAAGPQAGRRTPRSTPAQTGKRQTATQARPAAAQTHVVDAEFVSYDAKTKTMTVKDEKGQTSTAPLEGRAIREFGQLRLKNGDHVMLTCRDNAKGEHQAVTDIKPANAKP